MEWVPLAISRVERREGWIQEGTITNSFGLFWVIRVDARLVLPLKMLMCVQVPWNPKQHKHPWWGGNREAAWTAQAVPLTCIVQYCISAHTDFVVKPKFKNLSVELSVYIHVWTLSVIPMTSWLFSYKKKLLLSSYTWAFPSQNLEIFRALWQFHIFYEFQP